MCAEFESVGWHSRFGDLHLQISKTQNGCQNVKKPPYFLSFFAQESTIDDFCNVFIIYFFSSVFGKKYPLFDLQIRRFYIFTVTIIILLKMLTILWFIYVNIETEKNPSYCNLFKVGLYYAWTMGELFWTVLRSCRPIHAVEFSSDIYYAHPLNRPLPHLLTRL